MKLENKRPAAEAAARRRPKKRFMKPPKVQEPKPQVSIYLIFEFHETTKGFKFSCQNSGETIKNFQTSQ